jgi:tRNA1Val (adenine37-N6)-methyltransferase
MTPGKRAFAEADLTRDTFLDGRLTLLQPRAGYRAATDPVLLAAATAARPGEAVLELGCGAGAALLALGVRVPGLTLTGVEVQPSYAGLACRNAALNAICAEIACADLAHLPPELRRPFDRVMMNPPFFDPTAPAAADPGRDTAQREVTPLAVWLRAGLARLRPGGWLTVIHRAERVPEILATLAGPAGAMALRPIAPRAGRPAGRAIVQARKGARGPFRLLAPLVMHLGPAHPGDQDHPTPEARAILRDAAPLDWD